MIIYTEPKEVNLRQLEVELGVSGVHVATVGDVMMVEAKCAKAKLEQKVAAHEADPDFVHPDAEALQAEKEALAAEQEADKATKREHLKTKLKLDDEDFDALLDLISDRG